MKQKLARNGGAVTPKLQELLRSIRPDDPAPDRLVFPAPKGGAISESNLNQRGWSAILTSLGLTEKEGIKMTLYNCRDTLITLQAIQGISSNVIARYEEALQDADRSIELAPTSTWALISRGRVYRDMGCYEKALQDANRAAKLEPNSGMVRYSRGRTYQAMDRFEEALRNHCDQ